MLEQKMGQNSLFWQTRNLTSKREDHLTEFVAACLRSDAGFAEAYLRILFADSPGFQGVRLKAAQTQVRYPERRCRPDLVLVLEDGKHVACEHKIDAGETLGTAEDEGRGQLDRYRELPVHAIAYVRADSKDVDDVILRDERYIRPKSPAIHFRWRDFYPAFEAASTDLASDLKQAFFKMGYTPPHAHVGELSYLDDPEAREKRREFAKLWDGTRAIAKEFGWKVGSGSQCQLYFTDRPVSAAKQVLVDPIPNNGATLRMRFTANGDRGWAALSQMGQELLDMEADRCQVESLEAKHVLLVDAPLKRVIDEVSDPVTYDKRLAEHVGRLLRTLARFDVT